MAQQRRPSGGVPSLRSHRGDANSMALQLSPFEDDESGDEFAPVPTPASVVRPPRISTPALGTFTPQISTRGTKTRTSGRDAKLFAAAGLDLFRQGLAFDGVQPQHHAPRHPAVTPNLHAIDEDSDSSTGDGGDTSSFSNESQAIVVFGAGPLRASGDVNACVANRVARASSLYWSITKVFAELQASSHCYLVPMADESGADSVRESEAIRCALTAAGISPHHIIMDCSAPSVVDNVVQLVPILRRLHIETVHVVTSQFHLLRARTCVDGILDAVADMAFTTRYHVAADGLRASERAQHDTFESVTLPRTRVALDDAIRRQSRERSGSSISGGSGRPRSASGVRRSDMRLLDVASMQPRNSL